MSRIVHLVGAPATGKTVLRLSLARRLGLPHIGIDDERAKILLPEERWPSRDDLAWNALAQHVEQHPVSILETGGDSTNDAVLLQRHDVFTVLCRAGAWVRQIRLNRRLDGREPMLGYPRNYVERLVNVPDPLVRADVVWNSETNDDSEPVEAAVRQFLGQKVVAPSGL